MTSFTEEEKIEFARLIGKLQSELDEKISHEDGFTPFKMVNHHLFL